MARKSAQSNRSRKSSKPMRAVSKPVAPVVPETEPGEDATPENQAGSSSPAAARRPAARKSRPYQHRAAAPTARLAGVSTFTISKEQEYAFIREDLRRLLVTAGILIVVMIGLLFLIDR